MKVIKIQFLCFYYHYLNNTIFIINNNIKYTSSKNENNSTHLLEWTSNWDGSVIEDNSSFATEDITPAIDLLTTISGSVLINSSINFLTKYILMHICIIPLVLLAGCVISSGIACQDWVVSNCLLSNIADNWRT